MLESSKKTRKKRNVLDAWEEHIRSWILLEMNTEETQCLGCCLRSEHKEATKVLDAAQEGKNAHGTHLV
jgi:hypothetical protein